MIMIDDGDGALGESCRCLRELRYYQLRLAETFLYDSMRMILSKLFR